MPKVILVIGFLCSFMYSKAQRMNLDSVLSAIDRKHPSVKMYDADIASMNAAAKGARSWMPPEAGAGFWMTPYNPQMWKSDSKNYYNGMGSFMLSAQQMFPNKKQLDANAAYMNAMSSVEQQNKNTTLNDLYALAKKNYFEWIILKKKLLIIEQDSLLLTYMISDAEIRFKNNMEKLSAYYKAKAAIGNLQSMRLMILNEIRQKQIAINTLMNRNANTSFDIDSTYLLRDYSAYPFDSTLFSTNRTDIIAIDKSITINQFKIQLEKANLKPQFGMRYDNMFAFGTQPNQFTLMGMVKIPIAPWSSKMNKATIESLKLKNAALLNEKQAMLNESSGMANSMLSMIETKKRQIKLYENNIIPALKNNYKTMQIGYEQNTEELFMLYDAWETLNMTQLDYLDQLQQLLGMQTELDKILQLKKWEQ
ncbi:MAG: TolC family protein [Bacteroidia bacterium]